ncbi:MAG: GTPase ObgE [Candidatus Omnitrophica bacterium]|nr:GTPase ObgE [Candidatus Omnitrophota bacterium]
MIFVDEARIFVQGGDGGQGCESFYRDKYMRYPRPDGGDGGKGGDVIVCAQRSIRTLLDFKFRQHHKAHKGGHASSKGKTGKNGKDSILRVPVGTIIRDQETDLLIKDLSVDQQSVVVAKGGEGGIGNARRKTRTPPENGQKRTIGLELKLVADVGIVGFPNAGKSTLISNISRVKSKIARYPFTTKQPILGIVEDEDEFSFIVADLPGIIEGAHEGKGLGDRFLRHAERTRILMHLVDMSGSEGRDPLDDYRKIDHELEAYGDTLAFKHKLIVANKMDLPEAEGHLTRFRDEIKEKILPVSALEKKGLEELVGEIKGVLCSENFQEK